MRSSRAPVTENPPDPEPSAGRPRRFSRISIQSKLLVMMLVTSVLSVVVVGAIGFQSGRESLRDSVFDRLTLIRGAQVRLLEKAVLDLTNSMVVYTRGATAEQAIGAFAR